MFHRLRTRVALVVAPWLRPPKQVYSTTTNTTVTFNQLPPDTPLPPWTWRYQ
jgi:hypothetical protein